MTQEMKISLFEKVLELENKAVQVTYDNRNYSAEAYGAFQMLQILGISKEYINWLVEK